MTLENILYWYNLTGLWFITSNYIPSPIVDICRWYYTQPKLLLEKNPIDYYKDSWLDWDAYLHSIGFKSITNG